MFNDDINVNFPPRLFPSWACRKDAKVSASVFTCHPKKRSTYKDVFNRTWKLKIIKDDKQSSSPRSFYASPLHGTTAWEAILLQTGDQNRILSKKFWSDQWAAAPLQRVANQWVALGGRFHPNQFKTGFYPPAIIEWRLPFSSGKILCFRSDVYFLYFSGSN